MAARLRSTRPVGCGTISVEETGSRASTEQAPARQSPTAQSEGCAQTPPCGTPHERRALQTRPLAHRPAGSVPGSAGAQVPPKQAKQEAHFARSSWLSAWVVQRPLLPAAAQVRQSPAQADSQQTPSTHLPVPQAPSTPQGAPCESSHASLASSSGGYPLHHA